MGSAQLCFCNRHLIISLLYLLLSCSTVIIFVAEGRAVTKILESAQVKEQEEKVWIRTEVIGSTPPRCERRCSTCGHCEAVQVPVAARVQINYRTGYLSGAISTTAYSRGDDLSNYKPMSWKCKCGNLIFNP